MCGIAGVARQGAGEVSLEALARMAAALRHRGPDGYGFYVTPSVGFAHVRLSIIDLTRGAQPLASEGARVVVSFNGEIFNYRELRRELAVLGHVFRTKSDTEVLVHGWEQWGADLFPRLNGQFAFALHDTRSGDVLLVRDRLGVRPLFYSQQRGDLFFASEAKALFASGEVDARPDPAGIDEVFSLWSSRAPRTPFAGVEQLPPGHYGRWHNGTFAVGRWFTRAMDVSPGDEEKLLAELDTLLRSAVDFRLRSDVPVGGFLSGGLDSSIVCALAAGALAHPLRTFSVAFSDPQYDESVFQRHVAAEIHSRHSVVSITQGDIATHLPAVVQHVETPLTRTGPVPLYLLAKLARESGVTVALSGEGADELFLGYDLFKEVKLRLFCQRRPDSVMRPRLFERLYGFQGDARARRGDFWHTAFRDAGATDDPLFSHQPRLRLTARIKDYYAPAWRAEASRTDVVDDLRSTLPVEFSRWSPLQRAAWLEEETLLSGYLLAAQGDRVSMAHGVEGRYPFLDHRLAAFARSLPESARLPGLKEKRILKRWARDLLPFEVRARTKQPYRAPDLASLLAQGAAPSYVHELLSAEQARSAGYFAPEAVAGLTRRAKAGQVHSVREGQALVAILTTHLWHEQFVRGAGRWRDQSPLAVEHADVMLSPVTLVPT